MDKDLSSVEPTLSNRVKQLQPKTKTPKRLRSKSTPSQTPKTIDLEGMLEVGEILEPPPTEPPLYQKNERNRSGGDEGIRVSETLANR